MTQSQRSDNGQKSTLPPSPLSMQIAQSILDLVAELDRKFRLWLVIIVGMVAISVEIAGLASIAILPGHSPNLARIMRDYRNYVINS